MEVKKSNYMNGMTRVKNAITMRQTRTKIRTSLLVWKQVTFLSKAGIHNKKRLPKQVWKQIVRRLGEMKSK